MAPELVSGLSQEYWGVSQPDVRGSVVHPLQLRLLCVIMTD